MTARRRRPQLVSADPVEVIAPVSPATAAVESFHKPHPELEVHCSWCHRVQADCADPDGHDRLSRTVVEYPQADPIRPCSYDGRALRDHGGPWVLVDGMLFGLLACAQAYSHDWPAPTAPQPAITSVEPVTVQIHIIGGLPYLPGDVVNTGDGSGFVVGSGRSR